MTCVQKFVTGLLGVADDMERALESVPADAAQQKDPAALLKGLRDGIALTHKTLEKVPLTDRPAHVLPWCNQSHVLATATGCSIGHQYCLWHCVARKEHT